MLEWRPIEEFPGHSVSEFGHVVNDRTDRYLRVRQNKQGVMMVGMMRDGQQHIRSVARLVGNAFVDQEHRTFNTIIHLNGDKEDCRSFNLKWRSRPFALQYHAMLQEDPLRISVYVPQLGESYGSLRELCTKYGMVEQMAYRSMANQEGSFPYGWLIEEIPK